MKKRKPASTKRIVVRKKNKPTINTSLRKKKVKSSTLKSKKKKTRTPIRMKAAGTRATGRSTSSSQAIIKKPITSLKPKSLDDLSIQDTVLAVKKRKLNILILIRAFDVRMPKHKHKFDTIRAIGQYANVRYWSANGSILDILKKIDMKPDFIFHYDFSWDYSFAPLITDLPKIDIPKGCYVLDVHWKPHERKYYFDKGGKPDLIFSASKYPFLKVFPECEERFVWSPFAVNTDIIKDYHGNKEIDFSLMGLLRPPGRYPFREEVLKHMNDVIGFEHYIHPGHRARDNRNTLINDRYAKEINRSKIFFTCGSNLEIPVAKYFEGPGCNSMLMAEPNRDIIEIGFIDGHNFVSCHADQIKQKALYYQKNHKERERISQNGYEFIHTYHTNNVRAQQIVATIEDLLRRKKRI